jgi:hypothetical protein
MSKGKERKGKVGNKGRNGSDTGRVGNKGKKRRGK